VNEAIKLSEAYQYEMLDKLERQTVTLAESIKVSNDNIPIFQNITKGYVDNRFFDGVTYYSKNKREFTQQYKKGVLFSFIDNETLSYVLNTGTRCGFSMVQAAPVYWCGSPTRDIMNDVQGAVFTVVVTTPKIVEGNDVIFNMYELMRQLKFYSHPVSTSFNIFQFLIALLIMFASMYGSIRFVRGISEPLKELAAAADGISSGNLDTKVTAMGRDEIAILSKAFNSMASNLKERSLELHKKNEDLDSALTQISRDKKYIDTIYRNVDSALFLFDPEFNVLKANDYAEELMETVGGSTQEMATTMLKNFADSSDLERIANHPIEINGETKIFIAHVTKILDAYGNIANMVLVLDDNTALINLQRITLWKEVATRIAHEVKNPLTPIKLAAERVKKRSHDIEIPQLREMVGANMQMIVTEVDELIKLMDEFNMYAKPPSVTYTDFALAPLVREVVNIQMRDRADILVDVPENIIVHGDRHQIKRVFVNLVQNALQAVSKERGTVKIIAKAGGGKVAITVQDDGCGINNEDLQNIFVPYFSKKPTGTGLGLAIVEKIIEEHGGTITAESKVGEFTRFNINLPYNG
jgi:two-component system nitrogen regulation sensor histidine kinase NtrY